MKLSEDPDLSNLVGLDCEMVGTTQGSELVRVSLVDAKLNVLLDKLVKPRFPITDYRTAWSGVSEATLACVSTTLPDVQHALQKLLHSKTIIIGHSLENDLSALKLVHRRVVDTSILFPHQNHLKRNSLQHLTKLHLAEVLDRSSGHSSVDDATAAMKLVLLKIHCGVKYGGDRLQPDKMHLPLHQALFPTSKGVIDSKCTLLPNSCKPVLSQPRKITTPDMDESTCSAKNAILLFDSHASSKDDIPGKNLFKNVYSHVSENDNAVMVHMSDVLRVADADETADVDYPLVVVVMRDLQKTLTCGVGLSELMLTKFDNRARYLCRKKEGVEVLSCEAEGYLKVDEHEEDTFRNLFSGATLRKSDVTLLAPLVDVGSVDEHMKTLDERLSRMYIDVMKTGDVILIASGCGDAARYFSLMQMKKLLFEMSGALDCELKQARDKFQDAFGVILVR